MYGDKIGTEGSVLQELCHIVIPTDINGYIPDKYRRCNARVPNKPYSKRIATVHQTDVLVRFVRWKVMNMFKTFERTERTPPDITGQGTESPDEKRTKNGYQRTRTDKTIFYPFTRPLAQV